MNCKHSQTSCKIVLVGMKCKLVQTREHCKIMINSNNRNLHSDIQLYGENLEEVDQFKYLGNTITKDVSNYFEIEIRLA